MGYVITRLIIEQCIYTSLSLFGSSCLVVKSCPTLVTPWTVAHKAPLLSHPGSIYTSPKNHFISPKPLFSQERYFFMEEKRAYLKYNETPTISHATYSFCTQGDKPEFGGGLVRSASCRAIISQSSKISYNLLLIFLTTQNKRIILYTHSKCLFSY